MCKHRYHVPLVALAPSSCRVLLQTSWGASCFVSCTLHPSKESASVFSTTPYKSMSTQDAFDFQYNCDETFTDLCQCDLAAFLADGLFEQCLLTTISAELPPRHFLNLQALRSQLCTVQASSDSPKAAKASLNGRCFLASPCSHLPARVFQRQPHTTYAFISPSLILLLILTARK